jgi:class 3 adenylate cyclase/pimeloyl-ACP methyl ester carboxylesterase
LAQLVPDTRFTRSGNVDLAYQVVGDGSLDIVLMIGWVSHLEVIWELPEVRHFIERLAGMGRVALFDKRGTGLSDRSPIGSMEEMVPDVLAVMDATGMERAVLVGWSDAAAISLMCAAAHPDRVQALVLGEMLATGTPDATHPWGVDPAAMEMLVQSLELGSWGQGVMLSLLAPSLSGDERILAWFRKLERMSATPSIAADLLRRTLSTDVRPILSGIETPALLVHRSDAELIPSEAMQWLADALPNGRYAGVPGDQITGYLGDVDALMDEIEEFLHGTRLGSTASSQVITVLFTDVVGSTERVSEVGDRQWHRLLESHREEARLLLGRWGGREVGTSGDGLFAVFDAPTPAIRCALAMCASSQSGGLDIRAGIHTGEVEVDGADFIGLGVHLGSRVMSLAGAGEVLVSQTVRDLVMGSGFDMVSRGRHELNGVPGTWEVFGVAG